MSGGGGGGNPLSHNKIGVLFVKEKKTQMLWNVKICIWKDFKLFLIIMSSIFFSKKEYVLDHPESVDMQIEKELKKTLLI